jgi:hypothetical protein
LRFQFVVTIQKLQAEVSRDALPDRGFSGAHRSDKVHVGGWVIHGVRLDGVHLDKTLGNIARIRDRPRGRIQ